MIMEKILQQQNNDKDDFLICPMIDARRMEVYTEMFDKQLNSLSEIEAKIVDPDSFADLLLTKKIVFAGNGAIKCKETLISKNACFIPNIATSAANMVKLSLIKHSKAQYEDVAYFEPYYLKEFVAGKKSTN